MQLNSSDKKLQEQLKLLLEVPALEKGSTVLKKVKDVYAACMDEAMIEKIGLQPLVDKLDTIGGWPLLQVGKSTDFSHFIAFTREACGMNRPLVGLKQHTSLTITASVVTSSLHSQL